MITEQHGRPLFWNGHLCEGEWTIDDKPDAFLLWTRCKLHDVPTGAARELTSVDRITCEPCQCLNGPIEQV